MEVQLKGGKNGNVANVDTNERLHVQSVTETEELHSTETGSAFNLNTGLIATFSGDGTLAYVKNTDPSGRDLVIEQIIIGISAGITHTTIGYPYATLVDTPTAGNLISDATTTGTINRNRNNGKSGELQGVFYKGKVSGTQSGGNDSALFQLNPTGRTALPINWIVGKGKSVAVDLSMNISSGDASLYAAFICYYKDLQSRD